MARFNLYVSDDLRRRIDKVKEPVNWSAIAAEAFERKLGEIAERKEKKTMQDVVQRLRASRLSYASDMSKEGHEFGQTWAKEHAEAHELKRLDEWRNGDGWDTCFEIEDGAYGPDELFLFTIRPENDGDRSEAVEFWELVFGGERDDPRQSDPAFVRGFAEGALEVWWEVEKSI